MTYKEKIEVLLAEAKVKAEAYELANGGNATGKLAEWDEAEKRCNDLVQKMRRAKAAPSDDI